MKSNYYNFKKYKDKYLLTNEEGKYIFLSEEWSKRCTFPKNI